MRWPLRGLPCLDRALLLLVALGVGVLVPSGDEGTAHASPPEPKEIGNEHFDSFEEGEPPWDLGLGRWGRYVLLGGGALVVAAAWLLLRRRSSRAPPAHRPPRESRSP